MATYDRTDFAHRLLAELGAPATATNVAFLLAWMQREGTSAAYNPLATALRVPGSTDFNHLSGGMGVQNYPSLEVGVDATARTLQQSNFAAIRADLLDGNGEAAALEHDELTSWSGGGYDHITLGPYEPDPPAPPAPTQGDDDLMAALTEAQAKNVHDALVMLGVQAAYELARGPGAHDKAALVNAQQISAGAETFAQLEQALHDERG